MIFLIILCMLTGNHQCKVLSSTFNTLTLDYDTWRLGHAISNIDVRARVL